MPNKDAKSNPVVDVKAVASPVQQGPSVKAAVTPKQVAVAKIGGKETAMSPTGLTPVECDRTELLGSLTTQQQQRTSARVIKKLRLEPIVDKEKRGKRLDGTDEIPECETPSKVDEKDPLKFPTVKQRMPKALWSTDEKSLFFEALNEYGKDFDAITAYICAKMKKKGMADVNLKTKTQVSHFYYRTWHKLSKHVHFDENVKKVAQELYALINYGELRKKLVSVNEKTCARLGEMVLGGSMVVRSRGRNLRVRTPACRALRKLNQINERACGSRVCSRAQVVLRARCAAAWARVQAAAHNPRAAVAAPLRTPLAALLHALQARWTRGRGRARPRFKKIEKNVENNIEDGGKENEEHFQELQNRQSCPDDDEKDDLEDHLGLETDRIILQEQKLSKKPVLHVGPRPSATIHFPTVSPSEQLSSQKICFSSYLERMCSQRDARAHQKIRTPKRQRKDSTTESKEIDSKKFKIDDDPIKLNIDETAIDGIELMAHYKHGQEDEDKNNTEDEKELKSEETAEDEPELPEKELDKDLPERDRDTAEKDMSEKEKDSFSEMEDDEKYNKSESDNESDQGKEKRKERKFKNLKVKFRIRPKKRGGMYAVVVEKEGEDKEEGAKEAPPPPDAKEEPREEDKPQLDLETAERQVRRGWSAFDAGDLTVGDLYLMFGSRSRLELDYWWAEPTPPLHKPPDSLAPTCNDRDKKEKADKTPDKDKDSSVEDEKRESDTDIFSPKNVYNQDSNDGLSGDERKNEQAASPEHKSSLSGSLRLVDKLVNRPAAPAPTSGFPQLADRLKRLLALAGNPHVVRGACAGCGLRRPPAPAPAPAPPPALAAPPAGSGAPAQIKESAPAVFRHPTPIAPRPHSEPTSVKPMSLEDLPRWRRGRPRLAARRVVVQRLLPLLPKLPPPSNLIPVKIVPNSPPAPPRILPKPPPTSTSDLSFFYVLSESNGQFFFHDGDRRIPITPLPDNKAEEHSLDEDDIKEENEMNNKKVKMEISNSELMFSNDCQPERDSSCDQKTNADLVNLVGTESLSGSLSPARILREAVGGAAEGGGGAGGAGWLDGSVHDFSLSSFLGHLEGRPQPDLAVESHLQSLMAESSVDYVAKFADLAAEVTKDT